MSTGQQNRAEQMVIFDRFELEENTCRTTQYRLPHHFAAITFEQLAATTVYKGEQRTATDKYLVLNTRLMP